MKRFSWIKCFLLGFVTCGIYYLYMWHTMAKNNNDIAAKLGIKDKRMCIILALLLVFVTCGIVPLVWMYRFARQQIAVANAKGVITVPTQSPIVLFLVYVFVPVYNFYAVCENYNRTVDAFEG